MSTIINKTAHFSGKKNLNESNLNRPRLPYEVESWAFNFDKQAQNQLSVFNEFTDDSYLDNLLPFTDGVNRENEMERRLKIREILKNIRSNRSRSRQVSKIQPFYSDDDYKNTKNSKNDTQKFETISNGMSRAIPGVLQQNITLERTYFNDLILLSKQRYTMKRSLEYQQKIFQNRQEFKGLTGAKKKTIPKNQIKLNNKKQNTDKKFCEEQKEKHLEKKIAIRPVSVSGYRLSSSSTESFQANSQQDFKHQHSFRERPRTSEPYFKITEEKVQVTKSAKESLNEHKKPLEDKRFKDFLSSMSDCYFTEIKAKEQKPTKSSLRKIISKNDCLKDFRHEKLDGTGSNDIEIKKKVFERLAGMSELMI